MKTCCKCNETKSLEDFHNNKSKKDGKSVFCKECNWKHRKNKTKEQADRDSKKWRDNNKEKTKEMWAAYYEKNKQELMAKAKIYRKTERSREIERARWLANRDKINERRKIYRKNMSPKSKASKILRDRFNKVIIRMKSGKKYCSWRDLVGCTIDELKIYIESKFAEGMSWSNHGNGEGKWNIDHIKPLCTFDLMDLEEQHKAFHYSNLRPLWFVENMSRERKKYKVNLEKETA